VRLFSFPAISETTIESGHHGFPYPASYLVKKTGKFKNAVKQYAAGSYASHRQLFKNRFAAEIHMNIATK
jgi:hypothetical protein